MFRDLLRALGGGDDSERQAENAINRRIFETSLDLILVVDRKGNFLRISSSSLAIVGYRPEEMVGRSGVDFVYPPDLDPTRNEMRMGRKGRLMRSFDCRYVHKDGRVVPLAWAGVWSEEEQQHFFIGRDMTDRLAAEDRLRRAQRLEAVGQLTGGIAHDFNNLLAVIIGNLDLLEQDLAGSPAAQYAAAALKASLRGAELTRQLLAFGRRQPLDTKVVDLNDRVEKTSGLLRRTLGDTIEITTLLHPDLWPALADPVQFDAALVNLAINSRDAMRNGGRLTIETENRRLDELHGADFEVAPGDYVMVAVTDTGTGMPPEVLARAFEPFFTTKGPGEASGLGLSMVFGFARQSKGDVKIYSEVGQGTTVRLYLPRATDAQARAEDVAGDAALPLARPGERIMIVEDNPEVRNVVIQQVRSLGYDVVADENAVSALQRLRQGGSASTCCSATSSCPAA